MAYLGDRKLRSAKERMGSSKSTLSQRIDALESNTASHPLQPDTNIAGAAALMGVAVICPPVGTAYYGLGAVFGLMSFMLGGQAVGKAFDRHMDSQELQELKTQRERLHKPWQKHSAS